MSENRELISGFTGKIGILLLMFTVTILFGALSLAFFFTPKSGGLDIPTLFYLNTILLVVSSAFLQAGWVRRGSEPGKRYVNLAILLGACFLIGQGLAYWELAENDMWIDVANRQTQYLYVLSGLHALHLIGGILFIAVVHFKRGQSSERHAELALFFWHFLGILWIYLLFVMKLGA